MSMDELLDRLRWELADEMTCGGACAQLWAKLFSQLDSRLCNGEQLPTHWRAER